MIPSLMTEWLLFVLEVKEDEAPYAVLQGKENPSAGRPYATDVLFFFCFGGKVGCYISCETCHHLLHPHTLTTAGVLTVYQLILSALCFAFFSCTVNFPFSMNKREARKKTQLLKTGPHMFFFLSINVCILLREKEDAV